MKEIPMEPTVSADEWGKLGREAAQQAIKATLAGSQGWAQRLQDIAKHASETEVAIRQTMIAANAGNIARPAPAAAKEVL